MDADATPENILPIGQTLVNLAGTEEKDLKILKVTSVLELQGGVSAEALRPRLGQIKGEMLMMLNGKTPTDVDTPQKKDTLRKEIVEHLNSHLGGGMIKNIYFSDFTVQ